MYICIFVYMCMHMDTQTQTHARTHTRARTRTHTTPHHISKARGTDRPLGFLFGFPLHQLLVARHINRHLQQQRPCDRDQSARLAVLLMHQSECQVNLTHMCILYVCIYVHIHKYIYTHTYIYNMSIYTYIHTHT